MSFQYCQHCNREIETDQACRCDGAKADRARIIEGIFGKTEEQDTTEAAGGGS